MKKLLIIIACILILFIGGYFGYMKISNKSITSASLGKLKLEDNSIVNIPELIIKNEAQIKTPSSVFRDIAGSYESNYLISYLPYNAENSQIEFNILLNALPLSKARLEAEDVLRAKLGVTNQELCKMNVSVYVFKWVDENYAGENLGLSFCKNAVPLP